MRILICNPNTNRVVRNQAGVLKNTVAICPPLGIGYVTAALRRAGHEAWMVDFFDAPDTEIEAMLRRRKPDVVGVSCFTEHRGAALEVARIAKRVDPDVHVMLGGSHASFFPRQMLEHYPEVDAVVRYEAEQTVTEWVRYLDEGLGPEQAPGGVAFRGPEGIIVTERCPMIQDLDGLAPPVREVENSPPYKPYPPPYRLGRQATMMSTRGCPYKCQFCSTTQYWGSRYRTRSAGNVLDELAFLVKEREVDHIQFFDDAMTARKQWILELCDGIVKRGLRFDWDAITRANYVDETICRAMRRAGCRSVIFGIESFSDRILKSIHKGIGGEQAVAALKTARRAGLRVDCLLMVGNPGETEATVAETRAGIRRARPHDIDVCITAVFPETELYRMARTAGLLDDDYWLDESLSAPLFTVEHSVETLREFKASLYDAHWSSRPLVRLYRGLGLRRLRHAICPPRT